MPSKDSIKDIGRREASPVVMIIGVVILILALGAGGFYAFNGGWKTSSQQDYQYQHELMPIMAAKHGNTEALDAENQVRKQRGDVPLKMPKDNKSSAVDNAGSLQKLQDQLRAKGAGQ
jgi:hypothetical protein